MQEPEIEEPRLALHQFLIDSIFLSYGFRLHLDADLFPRHMLIRNNFTMKLFFLRSKRLNFFLHDKLLTTENHSQTISHIYILVL